MHFRISPCSKAVRGQRGECAALKGGRRKTRHSGWATSARKQQETVKVGAAIGAEDARKEGARSKKAKGGKAKRGRTTKVKEAKGRRRRPRTCQKKSPGAGRVRARLGSNTRSKLGRNRAKFGRAQAVSCRYTASFGRFWANLGRARARFGRNWPSSRHSVGQFRAKIGNMWPNLDRIRAASAPHRPTPAQRRPNLVSPTDRRQIGSRSAPDPKSTQGPKLAKWRLACARQGVQKEAEGDQNMRHHKKQQGRLAL